MKKIKYYSLILLLPLLTGCYNYRELNELAITTSVSIDYSDNNFNVIAEVVNPTKQQDAISANNSPFVNYYSTAPSLQEAFRNIVLESPRQLYAAQLEMIIISEEAAQNHIAEILEFFSRETEPRTELKFIIARGKESLKSITFQTLLTNFSSSNIVQSLEVQSKVLGLTPVYTLNELLNMYLDPNLEITLPSVMVYGDEEIGDEKENITTSSPKAITKIGTTAIFKNTKLLGYLEEEDSKILNIMTGNASQSIIKFDYKDNYGVFELHRVKAESSADVKKNTVTIKLKGNAKIKEFHSNANIKNIKEIDEINRLLNKIMEEEIKNTFNKIRKEYNTDIFGFRQLYYKTNPKYYKENYENNWYEEIFPNLELKTDINLKLYEKGNTLGGVEYESKNK